MMESTKSRNPLNGWTKTVVNVIALATTIAIVSHKVGVFQTELQATRSDVKELKLDLKRYDERLRNRYSSHDAERDLAAIRKAIEKVDQKIERHRDTNHGGG